VRSLGNIVFWVSTILAVIILVAGLNMAFTDYRDGLSYDTALIVIAVAAAIMFIGILARKIMRDTL
jgi:predicted Na+-dependent transporter